MGHRWVPYVPVHLYSTWAPGGFHMGEPTIVTYGPLMAPHGPVHLCITWASAGSHVGLPTCEPHVPQLGA